MSSLPSFRSFSSTHCSSSNGVGTFIVGSLVGHLAGLYMKEVPSKSCPNNKQAMHWWQHPVTFGLISWCLHCPHCCPSTSDGIFLLSLCWRKHTHWKKGDCMLMFSFNLLVFQKFVKAYAQFVCLMLVFLSQLWMDFVMVTKISFIYIDFCLNPALYTNLRVQSPVLIVFIQFVAPLVAFMRINVPTLVTRWTQHLSYWFGTRECLMA